jgi:transposase InsO family protein
VTPGATPQAQTPVNKQMVGFLRGEFQVSERRACRVLGFWRSTQRHNSPQQEDDRVLVDRLRVLAQARPRFGYRRLHTLLRREGAPVRHKRVSRLCRTEGLAVRQKGRKKLTRAQRVQKPQGFCWRIQAARSSAKRESLVPLGRSPSSQAQRRTILIARAVNTCWRRAFCNPRYRQFLNPKARTPCERVPSMPARR